MSPNVLGGLQWTWGCSTYRPKKGADSDNSHPLGGKTGGPHHDKRCRPDRPSDCQNPEPTHLDRLQVVAPGTKWRAASFQDRRVLHKTAIFTAPMASTYDHMQ